MTTTHSTDAMTSEDEDNPPSSPGADLQDQPESTSKASTPVANTEDTEGQNRTQPIQKRRRVTRACDACRHKKIKCDGKQPCTHCTVYGYECTYDKPSNRRRNPAPAYIEALESRLQKAEAVLRTVLPGINLDDPRFDTHGIDQIVDFARQANPSAETSSTDTTTVVAADDDAQLQTMVEGTGSLDLDDQGHWDYHGTSSGFTFMRNLRAQFGSLVVPDPGIPNPKTRTMSYLIESPKSASSSPYDFSLPSPADLPDKDTAMQLCRNALEVACALMRFVHKPTFYTKVIKIYETDPDHQTNTDAQFLPLFYIVMAVGCLFSQTEGPALEAPEYEDAIEQGFQYFQTARNMLDITDCRDLTTLQAIVFMILFLQSTAKLATCYSYVGIALRSCCRLGLHRNIKNEFNPVEQEERKRIFWLIRKMDVYVGVLLGLPQMLSAEDMDQQLPIEVDDDFITSEGILPMPPDQFPLMRACNAHTSLVDILQKVVKYIYPIKGFEGAKAGERYSISHSRIREIEKDLQVWMDNLPMELRPSDDASCELARVQQLLRLSYAHVQMMMYRPFLHYVSQGFETRNVDKRSYACAAACVSVARNIVHITAEMKRRGLLMGSYWFVMYTAYFSVLSLVFFVFENPGSPTAQDIMRDATQGRDLLSRLAKHSLAADRCSHSLKGVFAELPIKLKERKGSSQSIPASRKRPSPGDKATAHRGYQSVPDVSQRPQHDSALGSSQGSPFSDQNAVPGPMQPTSMPSPSGLHPAVAGSPQLQSGQWKSVSADHTSSSGGEMSSQPMPFAQPLANNLLDLRGLMYPSTNPFAYGNQPLSILEDHQMMTAGQQSSFVGPTSNAFGTSINSAHAPEMSFEIFNNPMFRNLPQHGAFQPVQYGSTSSSRPHLSHIQMPQSNLDDGIWQEMTKGRTGLTPGVNLDELFGSDGGWNPGYLDQGYGKL